jgi:hypothetical protein
MMVWWLGETVTEKSVPSWTVIHFGWAIAGRDAGRRNAIPAQMKSGTKQDLDINLSITTLSPTD